MITIVFGKPGSGKTAYMTADAVRYMNGSEACLDLLAESKKEIIGYTTPEYSPVYSNYPITVPHGYGKQRVSYYVDGFHMGFQNEFVPVLYLPPNARVYLAEAQRYYNSRNSKDFPEWVSRYYEEHRHYGLNIMLDVQRPGLIDLNIRELCERFVEVVGIEHNKDKSGNIISTVFTLREFPDWKFVDKYLNGDDSLGELVQEVFEAKVISVCFFRLLIRTLITLFTPWGKTSEEIFPGNCTAKLHRRAFTAKGAKNDIARVKQRILRVVRRIVQCQNVASAQTIQINGGSLAKGLRRRPGTCTFDERTVYR